MFAITESVRKWHHYLLSHEFLIRTDHKSLQHLNQAIQTPEQHYWLQKLLGYNFCIVYKPGKGNLDADALSRHLELSFLSLSGVFLPKFRLLDKLCQTLRSDPTATAYLYKYLDNLSSLPKFSISDDLLYYNHRLLTPPDSLLHHDIFRKFHSSPIRGHSSFKQTLFRIQQGFYWTAMHSQIRKWITECLVYQQTKYDTRSPAGLLQPLPIPDHIYEDITMDFIIGLPFSCSKTTIFVVVNRFSKYAHFLPLPPHYTAPFVAYLFMRHISKLYGLPRTIVSDRDPLFLNTFWKEFFHLQGTTLSMSTT